METYIKPLVLEIATSPYERRRRKRLFLSFPVEISGVDKHGRKFMERTKTEDISDAGCRMHIKSPLRSGDFVDIQLVPPPAVRSADGNSMRFQIVWVQPENGGWAIGAKKVDKEKMWKVTFPHSR